MSGPEDIDDVMAVLKRHGEERRSTVDLVLLSVSARLKAAKYMSLLTDIEFRLVELEHTWLLLIGASKEQRILATWLKDKAVVLISGSGSDMDLADKAARESNVLGAFLVRHNLDLRHRRVQDDPDGFELYFISAE